MRRSPGMSDPGGPAAGMRVSALRIFPVKSAAEVDLASARLDPWGFEHDRRWLVVDTSGAAVTARERRALLQVGVSTRPDGGLIVTAPDRDDCDIAIPAGGDRVPITLSRIDSAVDAGAVAADWFSDVLASPVRLVWLDDPTARSVGDTHGGQPGDTLSFADAGPVLVASTTSLERLREWIRETAESRGEPIPEALPMGRFRPNIVVDGVDEPFAEDSWDLLRVGDVRLRFAEHCDRCAVPTIDPATLRSTKEPTRTLARHRQWDHKVHFGVRMIPVTTGRIAVGDRVEAG